MRCAFALSVGEISSLIGELFDHIAMKTSSDDVSGDTSTTDRPLDSLLHQPSSSVMQGCAEYTT